MNPISVSIVPCYPTLPAAALSDCLAGQPEIFILAVLAKAGLLLFLPFIHVLPAILPYIFYEHSYFQTIAVFPCRPPPHPISARYGKNQQKTARMKISKKYASVNLGDWLCTFHPGGTGNVKPFSILQYLLSFAIKSKSLVISKALAREYQLMRLLPAWALFQYYFVSLHVYKSKMTRFFRKTAIICFTASMLLASCNSDFQKIKKSSDPTAKFNAAIAYYKADSYLKALPLFEELLSVYRGTDKAQDVTYYYAYTNYRLEDYVMAQYYFAQYYHSYPHTPRAEECDFMRAFCEYMLSPVYSLDQTDTQKAMEAFQSFVDDFPNSVHVKESNKYIDLLRAKL